MQQLNSKIDETIIPPKKSSDFDKTIINILGHIDDLSEINKEIFVFRYLSLVKKYRGRSTFITWIDNIFQFLIVLINIAMLVLTSMQKMFSDNDLISWITLAVSFSGILILSLSGRFKVDRLHIILKGTVESLEEEGWEFIELSGSYRDKDKHDEEPNNHEKQFNKFCQTIERINRNAIRQEYGMHDKKVSSGGTLLGLPGMMAQRGAMSPSQQVIPYSVTRRTSGPPLSRRNRSVTQTYLTPGSPMYPASPSY
jgi:hypothetical protein